jgi:hypothetical protein
MSGDELKPDDISHVKYINSCIDDDTDLGTEISMAEIEADEKESKNKNGKNLQIYVVPNHIITDTFHKGSKLEHRLWEKGQRERHYIHFYCTKFRRRLRSIYHKFFPKKDSDE